MQNREITEYQIRKAMDMLFPSGPRRGYMEYVYLGERVPERAIRFMAIRALDAGMPVPEDPVRESLVAEVDKFLVKTGRAGVAQGLTDAILARFDVREKEQSDA